MARPLPNHPQLRGNYAPIQFEAECTDLIVEGSLPGVSKVALPGRPQSQVCA
ncbi:MAG: hypothetical protein CM15mP74_03720 [Halieaceae bacterium]|nr:MAG: hypothetical protein CM15mP74_03720 [Halieaceae bacterium]